MPAIAQGARSVARVVQIAGSACVEKRFNAYRDPPSVKLSRELVFYRAYPAVPIIPTLVSHRAPDTITLRYVEGERLIDLIESKAVDADDIAEVSEHYGTVLGQFFADRTFADQTASSDTIADAVRRIVPR